MRKTLFFFLGLLLVLALLVAARNSIICLVLEAGVRLLAGVKMEIASLKTDAGPSTIEIKGLKIHNPPGFSDPLMLAVDSIDIRYHWQEIFQGEIFLRHLRVSLQELDIIRSADNRLNVDAFNRLRYGRYLTRLTINNFTLFIGRVVYRDYTHTPIPLVKDYHLNINEHYHGIYGWDNLGQLVAWGVLNQTSIPSLIKVDIHKLKATVSGTLIDGLSLPETSIRALINNL